MFKIRTIGLVHRKYCQQTALKYDPIKVFNESKRSPRKNPFKYLLYVRMIIKLKFN